MNSAGEEDAAFQAKQKDSPKLLKFGLKMCGSIKFRKRVHTLVSFIHKQRSYRHFNATKYVFQCRHCNRMSDRFNPYADQCCACDVEIVTG